MKKLSLFLIGITTFIANANAACPTSAVCPDGGRTTQQMFDQSNYTNWDFTNIWDIDNEKNYPFLLK